MISGTVTVTRKGEARIRTGHPWIFRSDIEEARGVEPGSVVQVAGPHGTQGFAFYSSRSEIRLRMIARGPNLAPTFFADRLRAAVSWRQQLAPAPPPAASSTVRATGCRR